MLSGTNHGHNSINLDIKTCSSPGTQRIIQICSWHIELLILHPSFACGVLRRPLKPLDRNNSVQCQIRKCKWQSRIAPVHHHNHTHPKVCLFCDRNTFFLGVCKGYPDGDRIFAEH